MTIELRDLRSISARSNNQTCCVTVRPGCFKQYNLLIAGECDMQHNRASWTLKGYLRDEALDFEHDAAYSFSIDVIGLEFKHCWNGICYFRAFIDPSDYNGFRIPPTDYNPFCGASNCTECEETHPIVKEQFSRPKADRDLWDKLRGAEVTIMIGPEIEGFNYTEVVGL